MAFESSVKSGEQERKIKAPAIGGIQKEQTLGEAIFHFPLRNSISEKIGWLSSNSDFLELSRLLRNGHLRFRQRAFAWRFGPTRRRFEPILQFHRISRWRFTVAKRARSWESKYPYLGNLFGRIHIHTWADYEIWVSKKLWVIVGPSFSPFLIAELYFPFFRPVR